MDSLKILALFVVLVVAVFGLRTLPNRQRAAIWIGGTAILLPFWIRNGLEEHWTWFVWAKLFSIIFACLWAELCALRFADSPRLVAVSVWLILVINMAEAVAFDLTHGKMINATAGLLLIVSAALAPGARIAKVGRAPEVVYDLGWIWIVGYTIWNLCFVYGNTPGVLGRNIALLAAALFLASLVGQRSWLLLRAYSFGFFCFMVNTFYGGFQHWLDTSSWHDPAVYGAFSLISLGGALAAAGVIVFTTDVGWLLAWRPRRRT